MMIYLNVRPLVGTTPLHFCTFLSSSSAITLLYIGQNRHVSMHLKALFMLMMIAYRQEYIDKLCTSKSQAAKSKEHLKYDDSCNMSVSSKCPASQHQQFFFLY